MSTVTPPPDVYQLHVWLREISPMIWRRLLVRSDSSIADLHYTLQIAMGWEGYHLHQFVIRGKRYGVPQPGGVWFADDPTEVRLADLRLRLRERFLYEYDFGDLWQHEIRVEKKLPLQPERRYPTCICSGLQWKRVRLAIMSALRPTLIDSRRGLQLTLIATGPTLLHRSPHDLQRTCKGVPPTLYGEFFGR
jgi:Plasmid pRiA4b ORF-3-like protein